MVLGSECLTLRGRLAAVAEGRAFLVHCGHPVAAGPSSAEAVRSVVRVLRQMALIIGYASSLPLVQVARIGGPWPDRYALREEYGRALGELNLFRAFTSGDRFDLREVHASTMLFVRSASADGRYDAVAGPMDRAVRFLEASAAARPVGVDGSGFFVSWEAGPLGYEAAMTRREAAGEPHYNTSGHLLVLRECDQDPHGPHAEYCARIGNPVAVRIGPATRADTLPALLDRLDPDYEPGRIVLQFRLGDRISNLLPMLPAVASSVARSGHSPIWLADPSAATADELRTCFELLREQGAHVGGIHVQDAARCVELAFSVAGLLGVGGTRRTR
ncbi:3-deoxy-7-phosphoheptulonate synthase [Actinospica sp.]|uniref:3-deoxy-7-phosphoheptulonate synthase n=1 Tax=Actinospica sp. TaxID=1872142 RepID=UPI002CAC614A|nr:3-deoxy-7-phosphoheptulonate synthase [Actinospica sp.]HWG24300.1 3-deoxy-7-phosphoheptulonate synthase [Actinospica sp.]